MKRSRANHLSTSEREELIGALKAGENPDMLAQRFNLTRRTIDGYRGLLRGRVLYGRESRWTHLAADESRKAVPKVCMRAGCEREVKDGESVCDEHRRVAPVLSDSGFVKPPSLARLMAGR